MTFKFWPILLFVVVMSSLLVGVQIWNASKVDWDEFQRSWQSVLVVLSSIGGVVMLLRKKE